MLPASLLASQAQSDEENERQEGKQGEGMGKHDGKVNRDRNGVGPSMF